jgi:hypothetical protein
MMCGLFLKLGMGAQWDRGSSYMGFSHKLANENYWPCHANDVAFLTYINNESHMFISKYCKQTCKPLLHVSFGTLALMTYIETLHGE